MAETTLVVSNSAILVEILSKPLVVVPKVVQYHLDKTLQC